jgi:hypothetical protein
LRAGSAPDEDPLRLAEVLLRSVEKLSGDIRLRQEQIRRDELERSVPEDIGRVS